MRSALLRATATPLLVLILVFLPLFQNAGSPKASVLQNSDNRWSSLAPSNLGTFERKLVDGRAICLEAGTEQARSIRDRDPNLPLANLDFDPSIERQGLRILLRCTPQLSGFAPARAAFERAAARWEAVIRTRLTIVIDLDFGPTLFGKPFGENVAGTTDTQVLTGSALYPAVRASLISRAFTSHRTSLLDSLPARALPTDSGESAEIAASSATLRALGLINPIADLDDELGSFGLPPAIGMNSKFSFDFEPADGIAQDKLDFEAIALHEIGHILGFISCAGQHEMDSSLDVESSIWDLFRGRPDAIKSTFATAPRVLTSGGEQGFFAGGEVMPLSTGRPDGADGDGRQAAHWKDDNLTGRYIGVMDPTIGPGESQLITDNDIAVLDAIGYRVNQSPFLVPLVSGRPQTGVMASPPPNLGLLSPLQYSISVPPGSDQLRIELNGNQDVDLFVRFGERVLIQAHRPAADYVSASESGFEAITITLSSSPPVRAGTYFIAVVNFGPGDADFTITGTVIGGVNTRTPAIFNIRPRLEGDVLDLTYAAIDLDGNVAKADLTILDQAGRQIGQPSSFVVGSVDPILIESHLTIGLSGMPAAVGAGIVLIDRDGNRSPEATVDFSRREAGGLILSDASFDGSRLTIKTSGLSENLQIEINGRSVAPPRGIKIKGSSGKLIVKGDAAQLGLQQGANRIRVKNNRGWSNILILGT